MNRIVIVGAGIGGLALANGLLKHDVDVAVYERDTHSADRLDRYGLAINPAGSRSLRTCLPDREWELFQNVAGSPDAAFGFLRPDLRELVVVEESIMYPGTADPAERAYPVDRRSLRGVLLDGLDEYVNYGKEFEHYELAPDGRPTAYFADGTSATGDVLVGADGAKSALRAQYLPQAVRTDTDVVGVGMKLPLNESTRAWLPARLIHGMNIVLADGPHFLFTSVFQHRNTGAGDYLLCAFVSRSDQFPPQLERLDGAQLKNRVAALTSGWHPLLRRVLDECPSEDVTAFPYFVSDRPTKWTSSRVTVLGDAIHAMPPAGGNGANTALRDAALLSRRLRQADQGELPLVGAIGEYEADMLDYGFQAVEQAIKTLRQGIRKSSPIDLFFMHSWFRLCNMVTPLRRITFAGSWSSVSAPREWERPGTTT